MQKLSSLLENLIVIQLNKELINLIMIGLGWNHY